MSNGSWSSEGALLGSPAASNFSRPLPDPEAFIMPEISIGSPAKKTKSSMKSTRSRKARQSPMSPLGNKNNKKLARCKAKLPWASTLPKLSNSKRDAIQRAFFTAGIESVCEQLKNIIADCETSKETLSGLSVIRGKDVTKKRTNITKQRDIINMAVFMLNLNFEDEFTSSPTAFIKENSTPTAMKTGGQIEKERREARNAAVLLLKNALVKYLDISHYTKYLTHDMSIGAVVLFATAEVLRRKMYTIVDSIPRDAVRKENREVFRLKVSFEKHYEEFKAVMTSDPAFELGTYTPSPTSAAEGVRTFSDRSIQRELFPCEVRAKLFTDLVKENSNEAPLESNESCDASLSCLDAFLENEKKEETNSSPCFSNGESVWLPPLSMDTDLPLFQDFPAASTGFPFSSAEERVNVEDLGLSLFDL